MNILLINHYAGSIHMGMEFRPYYFAREWVKKGHNVNIIAADYSHLRKINPNVNEDFQKEVVDGINYYWIKTNKYDGNGIQRAKTMFKFVLKLMSKAQYIVDTMSPDVVICSSTYPLDTYAGQKIRKKSKKTVKLIHEVHDMWPISPIEIGGMSKSHPFIKIMQMGEDSFCKKSDTVVSLLPNSKKYFVEHGMREEAFRYIPNGVVLDEWNSYERIPDGLRDHFNSNKSNGGFNLVFFGSLHKTYRLETLIEAVKSMNDEKIYLTFIGPGMDRKELEMQSNGFEDRIRFFDPISKKAIPDLFNYLDATFVGLRDQSIARFGISMNKLFDSMMGGKPIVYMVDAPNNYIKEFDCGITVENNSKESLVKAIKSIMDITDKRRAEMGENGKKAALKHFNYTVLSQLFLDVMEE